MIEDGSFGSDRPKALGKPKWKLVNESLGKEVDISSSFCIPVKSRSMRKTFDADKEEWDIIDDGTDPTKIASRSPDNRHSFYGSVSRGTTAVKPSAERARMKSFSQLQSPSLLATLPGSGMISIVRIVGRNLLDNLDADSPRKRGRPAGSKNKPKLQTNARKVSTETKARSNASILSIGKNRRPSLVHFNAPASARKAAALRSTTDKKGKNRERTVIGAITKTTSVKGRRATSLPVDSFVESDESTSLDEQSSSTRAQQSVQSEETSDTTCSDIVSASSSSFEKSNIVIKKRPRSPTRRSGKGFSVVATNSESGSVEAAIQSPARATRSTRASDVVSGGDSETIGKHQRDDDIEATTGSGKASGMRKKASLSKESPLEGSSSLEGRKTMKRVASTSNHELQNDVLPPWKRRRCR